MKNTHRMLLATLLTLPLAGGCGPDEKPKSYRHSAEISGRFALDAGEAAPDGTVAVYQVVRGGRCDDGILEAVSSDVVPNADGTFVLTVQFDEDSRDELVVKTTINDEGLPADKTKTTPRSLVSGGVTPGAQLVVAPIDVETTVEAEVFGRMPMVDGLDLRPRMRALITGSAARATCAGADCTEAQWSLANDELAVALSAGIQARSALLLGTAMGLTQADLRPALDNETAARVALDEALHTATDVVGSSAAYDAYHQDVLAGFEAAGVDAAGYALALRVERTIIMVHATNLSAHQDGHFTLIRAHAETGIVDTVAPYVEAAFLDLGAPASVIDTLASASATLRDGIDDDCDGYCEEQAWATWDGVVITELKNRLDTLLGADGLAAVDAWELDVRALRTHMNVDIAAAGDDTSAVVAAYLTFLDAVRQRTAADTTFAQLSAAHFGALDGLLSAKAYIKIDGIVGE